MMRRTQAFEYIVDAYYVDEMEHEDFEEMMRLLIDTPHKPWCRTRFAESMPNYGSECTCDEGTMLQ
jgi:hypothetical protein